jgi:nitrate reductase assembly molybdenum cofactor insertion protein NarJ
VRTISPAPALRIRSVAFALVARSLGPDASVLLNDDHVAALRTAIDEMGQPLIATRFELHDPTGLPGVDELAGRWVRWFDLGRVAPYEGSHVVGTAGGITPRLADVAGFYRAFGVAVANDRPDHVVAELEFLALALLREADAVDGGHHEQAEIAGDAIRTFLRDHIGMWIGAWAGRVVAIDELAAWAPFATAAADLVRHESALRDVIPAQSDRALPADAGRFDDEPPLECD